MTRPKRLPASRRDGASRRVHPGGPPTIGSALNELFALKGYANAKSDAELADAWKAIAGERIATRTSVMGIHRGVLQIAVVSSAMMNELASFHKTRLLESLQEKHPDWKIKGIKFRLRGDLAKPFEQPANQRE